MALRLLWLAKRAARRVGGVPMDVQFKNFSYVLGLTAVTCLTGLLPTPVFAQLVPQIDCRYHPTAKECHRKDISVKIGGGIAVPLSNNGKGTVPTGTLGIDGDALVIRQGRQGGLIVQGSAGANATVSFVGHQSNNDSNGSEAQARVGVGIVSKDFSTSGGIYMMPIAAAHVSSNNVVNEKSIGGGFEF